MLNALSAHIAVLDGTGRIVSVNEAWRRFGRENGLRDPAGGVGASYLDVCDRAAGGGDQLAAMVAAGLRSLAAGGPALALEYPCHGPAEPRWFQLRATRFEAAGETRIAVAHENVTARKLAEERLERRGRALEALNAISVAISGELDRDRLVQLVVDGARALVGAAFGAFFHNVVDPSGESYTLYTLSGAPREAFASFPMPRNTAVFAPDLPRRGRGAVRRHHQGPALRPQRALPRDAGRAPAGAQLSRGPVVGRSARSRAGCSSGTRNRRYSASWPSSCWWASPPRRPWRWRTPSSTARPVTRSRSGGGREETQALLLAELNHRVKNTLAVVGSVARASFADTRTLAEGREALTARLVALARAHDLLTASGWRGPA